MKRSLKLPLFVGREGKPRRLAMVERPVVRLSSRGDASFSFAFFLASLFLVALGYAGSLWLLPNIIGSIKTETEAVAFEISEGEALEELVEVVPMLPMHLTVPPVVPVPPQDIPSVEVLSISMLEQSVFVEEPDPSELAEILESALVDFPEASIVESEPKKEVPRPQKRRTSKPTAKNSPSNRVATETKPKATKRSARLLHRVSPTYPVSARRSGEEGRVVVTITIGADGKVNKASVSASSGSRVLDQAALRAVKKWKFQPAMVSGRAVPAQVSAPVVFSLN